MIPTPTPSKPALNTADHYAYIRGYPDGTVQPGGYITRAEASTIFFRLLTDKTREQYWATTNAYSDIKSGDWYNNAISTLSNAGIVSGYPDGTFRPNAAITRAEFAAIAARFDNDGDKTAAKFMTSQPTGPRMRSASPTTTAGSTVIPTAPSAPSATSPVPRP